ncbi:MAG TPA: hypothetical protein VFJ06_10355 [Halococcus sp.]|nr:hypothetical protein [Halococcus sp.]
MTDIHASESFAPVILGLGILVVTPALALLVPNELIATLAATPLRRAVSAFVVLMTVGVALFWAVSRVSLRATSAVEGAQGGEN